jgi:WD40 repeat protein
MHIASAGDDGTVQVWDAATGNNVYTYHGHAGQLSAVAWSPDGTRIASGGADKTVQVWQAI